MRVVKFLAFATVPAAVVGTFSYGLAALITFLVVERKGWIRLFGENDPRAADLLTQVPIAAAGLGVVAGYFAFWFLVHREKTTKPPTQG